MVEPTRSIQGSEDFDAAGMVERLHAAGKLVLAYLDFGQAEDYRTYWGDDWRPPADDEPGRPDFMVAVDPAGWEGNYPVAFWDPRWWALLWDGEDSPLQQILDDGFDGVYLDWVEAYEDPDVAAAAEVAGIAPAAAMVELIRELGERARGQNPDFVVVAQNAPELLEEVPSYTEVIDGLGIEDLTFSGGANTEWGEPESGDIATDPDEHEYIAEMIGQYEDAGVPVFCIDYALEPGNVRIARENAEAVGCVSFVSQTPLDRLP